MDAHNTILEQKDKTDKLIEQVMLETYYMCGIW